MIFVWKRNLSRPKIGQILAKVRRHTFNRLSNLKWYVFKISISYFCLINLLLSFPWIACTLILSNRQFRHSHDLVVIPSKLKVICVNEVDLWMERNISLLLIFRMAKVWAIPVLTSHHIFCISRYRHRRGFRVISTGVSDNRCSNVKVKICYFNLGLQACAMDVFVSVNPVILVGANH